MSFILIAILSYFVLAIVNLADKFILEQVVPRAKTYTFLVGFSGLLIFIIAPWFLTWPGWTLGLITILTGIVFSMAILSLYEALKRAEASQVITLVGGTVPVISFLFSIFLFKESFVAKQLLAIFLLIAGTVLISVAKSKTSLWSKIKAWFRPSFNSEIKSIVFSLLSALGFALYWVGTKYSFSHQSFFSALIWIRLGSFLAVLILIVRHQDRQDIKNDLLKSNQKKQNKFIFFGTQALAALGSILQNYAVSLGSIVIVTSLQGVQYVFIIIFSALLSLFFPKIIKEEQSLGIIIRRSIAVLMIAGGLYLIS